MTFAVATIIGGGYFMAIPATIGLTDEEVEAAAAGNIDANRLAEIECILRCAINSMLACYPPGNC